MPHWKTFTDRNHLGACDLYGQEMICTILRATGGELSRAGAKKQRKTIVFFKGSPKGYAAGTTVCQTISKLAGSPLTENWPGTRVILYPTTAMMSGEEVEAIRVRPFKPDPKLPDTPWPSGPQAEIRSELSSGPTRAGASRRSAAPPTPPPPAPPAGAEPPEMTQEDLDFIREREAAEAFEQEQARLGK